ncbi:YgzB family protein [Rummeliibacillus pycnus]|uniref:YgzB family protein n=1 Tax=Rummeliibacillus pycnus TaxID=101070 RepID=UPI000C9CEEDB|nr:YgzB family protein [Rummeliibacillus pycnus]
MKSNKKPYKSKINKIRTFALSLIFIGFIIMYGAVIFREYKWLVVIFMTLGVLCIIGSTMVYAWIGFLSTQAVLVECPNCHKHTKVLGRVDMCMFCSEPLTLDKSLEGKEFNQDYNNKTNRKHKES